jgi:hypothetical protein
MASDPATALLMRPEGTKRSSYRYSTRRNYRMGFEWTPRQMANDNLMDPGTWNAAHFMVEGGQDTEGSECAFPIDCGKLVRSKRVGDELVE